MIPIAGVIFDKDGTLFDFSSTWEVWANAFLHRLARDEAHARAMGQAIGYDVTRERFAADSLVIAGTPRDIAVALQPHLPHLSPADLVDVLNTEAEKAPQVEAVPLHACLTTLQQSGLRLGVVTNDAAAPARAHLKAAGVTGYFDFIAGFDSGFGAKPDPGQLLAFADAMTLAPAAVVMVGDSLHDLMAARHAGMRAVGVLTGMAGAQELAPYADVVLPDIGHLHGWLQQGGKPAR